ncbi:MAG: redox-sensing transcriptional repressor Rex [Phycisphaerae bacterium]
MTSDKTIGRLSLYRRLLNELLAGGAKYVYSHHLANEAGVTAAQVRRDLMAVGYNGSPSHGYDVSELVESIRSFLDAPKGQGVALVGVGNLGRAILAYFNGRRPHLSIVAAFDSDPHKVGRVVHGCYCHPIEELPRIVAEKHIGVAIVAVPANEAQELAETLVRSGVRSLVNFVPAPLHVPPHVYVEDVDITTSLEKAAYFARGGAVREEVLP